MVAAWYGCNLTCVWVKFANKVIAFIDNEDLTFTIYRNVAGTRRYSPVASTGSRMVLETMPSLTTHIALLSLEIGS